MIRRARSRRTLLRALHDQFNGAAVVFVALAVSFPCLLSRSSVPSNGHSAESQDQKFGAGIVPTIQGSKELMMNSLAKKTSEHLGRLGLAELARLVCEPETFSTAQETQNLFVLTKLLMGQPRKRNGHFAMFFPWNNLCA